MVNPVERLAREVVGLRKQVQALSRTPQLAHSSLENGSIDEYDGEGNLVAVIGKQHDGSHGAYPVSGPTPPRCSAPTTEGGQSATVAWDGVFLDEGGAPDVTIPAPMGWSRAEVHLSQQSGFQADTAATLVNTIESPRGGSVVVVPGEGVWYAVLVSRSQSGKRGVQSPETAFEIVPGFTGEAGEELRDAIDDAARELGRVGQRVDVDLPQLIDDAAASPVTDARLPQDGSLTIWPFSKGTIPSGALAPGAVGSQELADFSLNARKFKTTQHIIY